MTKYRCKACGYIYDNKKEEIDFIKLPKKYHCPICNRKKSQFELADEFSSYEIKKVINANLTPYNAVVIDKNNSSIERVEGCINCGMCTKTCLQKENMPHNEKFLTCLGCGQCIFTCPKKVLQPKNEIYKFLEAKKSGKVCIAYIAPASRVSIGDSFGYNAGTFLGTKLVGLLKKIGFNYVFDVTFGADLTIMEEATEFIERLENKKNLPLFTSCCPSWVKYVENYYPEFINNLSTCKSPIGMEGTIVKKYFSKRMNIDEKNVFTVAITPCTAKKMEAIIPEYNTDLVITISELTEYLQNTKINFSKIKPLKFDKQIGEGSGAGIIFGSSGGVLEAVLRTVNYNITGKKLKKINIEDVRGFNGIKETKIKIGEKTLNVCAVSGLANVRKLLDQIKRKKVSFDIVEVMNCEGGCLGGGGQPFNRINEMDYYKEKRMISLYKKDQSLKCRNSFENIKIKKLYTDFLNYPNSPVAKELLHKSRGKDE